MKRILRTASAILLLASLAACSIVMPNRQSIEEGGLSFQPVVGWSVETEASQVTMTSRDERIRLVINGRPSCDIESLEALTPWLSSWARAEISSTPGLGRLQANKDLEMGEPYAIAIDDTQGLAVDVKYPGEYAKGTARAILVTPSESHLIFAFASVTDSPDGSRWEKGGEKAIQAVLQSIQFFEPAGATRPLPCFTNHTPPEVTVDIDLDVFQGLSCPLDIERGLLYCEQNELLAALGCETLQVPSGLLGALEPPYPIARCHLAERRECEFTALASGYQHRADGDCLYRVGGMASWPAGYVIFQEEDFILVATEDEFRALYAPIETASEALSYVLAVTGLEASYGLVPDPTYTYLSNVVEDTHVETVADGYLVHLYHRGVFGCGDHPVSLVVLHITTQGHIEQISMEKVYKDPGRDGWCID